MKVVGIVQARMDSTRRPGKVLAKVCGKPLLAHLLNRISSSDKLDRIVVATSLEPSNDSLVKWCIANNVEVFRGSHDNVLSRFYHCANKYKADIILFGVSRTSKTPTAIYLANKGIKVANIPFVLNQEPDLSGIDKQTLVIGLFASPERLQQIRTSRLHSLREKRATNYIDIEILKKEIEEAKKICSRNKWSTIDVTKKSIEEIAATALEYLKIFKSKAL